MKFYVHFAGVRSVEADANVGQVNIFGMVRQENGLYTPPDGEYLEVLELETDVGHITVNYQNG